ncbi:MAG: tRNA dihydrouridine(20/20a) synthase DusA [Myxococcales bacterium]|nr:tRNA dihydrouridine(20/20a) synthase DusA [Myxococcales bacterium]
MSEGRAEQFDATAERDPANPSPSCRRARGVLRPISVAPMMDRTDRHFRYFMRLISARALLYTEMVVAQAILHGNRDRLLGFDPNERPLALQLGGDDPRTLASCARIAEDWGYDEVNLNVGCPSDRVQRGRFGACLMAEPELVAEMVGAMRAACSLPVTVKHRIGIDANDGYEDLLHFVDVVREAGPSRFTVHARKAWLSGLSPRENRMIPPLRYGDVHRLKVDRPAEEIEINGGITSLSEVKEQLEHVDGVMVGRAAYEDPFAFLGVDEEIYGVPGATRTREEVAMAMVPYVARWVERGGRANSVLRHLHGLFNGNPGARAYRRVLSTEGPREGADEGVLRRALTARVSTLEASEPVGAAQPM